MNTLEHLNLRLRFAAVEQEFSACHHKVKSYMYHKIGISVIVSFLLNGFLISQRMYRLSYDAYIHMFFANHYQHNWWNLWDTRWYTGFYVNSYPPLVHQIIALLAHFVGIEQGWSIVLLISLLSLPCAVYAFSRIFIGPSAASYAAIAVIFVPSISLTAYTFGQLPTLVGLIGVLFALKYFADYMLDGIKLNLAIAIALIGFIVSSHHGTLLLLPWGISAICIHLTTVRKIQWSTALRRVAIFGFLAATIIFVVVWPFWQWGLAQTMQIPIDHASRHNFLQDSLSIKMFLWPIYGPLLFLIPVLLWTVRHKRIAAILCLFGVMFIQGLGGTTPLPRWLYGNQWQWLTYDRFALWASVMLTPLIGIFICQLIRRKKPILRYSLIAGSVIVGGTSLYSACFAFLLPTQPETLNLRPIVDFLGESDHDKWRYLTFGFGDQMALLSILTNAVTLDGSYHTARNLPVLRNSGIGQIDAVYWTPTGLNALNPILELANTYGVRWYFINRNISQGISIHQILRQYHWVYVKTLSNNVEIWENNSAVLPQLDTQPQIDTFASFSWGTLPLGCSVFLLALIWSKYKGLLRRN